MERPFSVSLWCRYTVGGCSTLRSVRTRNLFPEEETMARFSVLTVTTLAAVILLVSFAGVARSSCTTRMCESTTCVATGSGQCMEYDVAMGICLLHPSNPNDPLTWGHKPTGFPMRTRQANCTSNWCTPKFSNQVYLGSDCQGEGDWTASAPHRHQCCSAGTAGCTPCTTSSF